jgi:hypothetical protein
VCGGVNLFNSLGVDKCSTLGVGMLQSWCAEGRGG